MKNRSDCYVLPEELTIPVRRRYADVLFAEEEVGDDAAGR